LKTAKEVIQWAIERYGPTLVLSTSLQKGGMIVLDIAIQLQPGLRVVTLDTGRLPEATYSMIETVNRRFGISVEMIYPDANEANRMVSLHGPNLFLRDYPSRVLCCNVRKVRPLARKMEGVGAILTGLRRDQTETRELIEEIDESATPARINPLAFWSNDEIERYTSLHDLPVHPLYARGFTSIGCEPCTRQTSIGEEPRAGRWWWENEAGRECGLHFAPDGRTQSTVDVMLSEIVQHG
jgi:phosphoadenosine phosphosulfate reductase